MKANPKPTLEATGMGVFCERAMMLPKDPFWAECLLRALEAAPSVKGAIKA
ncbi:hypothetical protein MGR01S_19490 [Meiothermus granaticius NBRC 107808]|nr:hypothetical protein MGR01S_19490 [Meiothermus granaticius NBRC 107808]